MPYSCKMKNQTVQNRFSISWTPKNHRLLCNVGPLRFQARPMPMPMRMYRMVQTIGNTHAGGVNHGFVIISYAGIPLFVSMPPMPPMNRLRAAKAISGSLAPGKSFAEAAEIKNYIETKYGTEVYCVEGKQEIKNKFLPIFESKKAEKEAALNAFVSAVNAATSSADR